MSLGNALPTETTTATVDSCSVLQTKTNGERKEWAKGSFFYAENGRFVNVSGDSSSVNQTEVQHDNSVDISVQQSNSNIKHSYITVNSQR